MLTRLLAVLSALAAIVQLAMGSLWLAGAGMAAFALMRQPAPGQSLASVAAGNAAFGVYALLIGAFQLSAVLQLLEIPGAIPRGVRLLARLAAGGTLAAIVGLGPWASLDLPIPLALAATAAGAASAVIALALPKAPWSGAWRAACLIAIALMPVLPLASSPQLSESLVPVLGGAALLSIGFIASAGPTPASPEEPDAD